MGEGGGGGGGRGSLVVQLWCLWYRSTFLVAMYLDFLWYSSHKTVQS